MIDVKRVLEDFPILTATDGSGRTLCYLDSGATSQRPNQVLAAMDSVLDRKSVV